MSSIYGNNIKVSIFGQSHGQVIGCTIDGLEAGHFIGLDRLQRFLDRRAPGKNPYSTPRKEGDQVEVLSGLVNGITCGAPLTAIIRNTNAKPNDYMELARSPRPGHADFSAREKFGGFEDFRGGGHFSGRLTAAMCIAGGIFIQVLVKKGIKIVAEIEEIHGKKEGFLEEIEVAKKRGDSVGGIIKCTISGLKSGLGNPFFDGVENVISRGIFAIPGVKGIEFGSGFEGTRLYGSENNDGYYAKDGNVVTKTNNHGGILGGITTGMDVIFRVGIKPTPSIALPQDTIDYDTLKSVKISVKGRHDSCIVPRALPVVEAAAGMAVVDLIRD